MNITNWDNMKDETEENHEDEENKHPIHLISQWYQESNMRRRRELVAVLHMNVINRAVSQIHMIQPSGKSCTIEQDVQIDPTFPIALLKSKLTVWFLDHSSTERLTIQQAIDYANNNILQGYVALINLDTFFDQTISILSNGPLFDPYAVFYISRHEIDPSSIKLGNQCSKKYLGSHDALIFQPPITSKIARALPFEMGTWHIEAKVIHEFARQGYIIRNVCLSLRIWHLHSSQVRHRLMPTKKFLFLGGNSKRFRYPETL